MYSQIAKSLATFLPLAAMANGSPTRLIQREDSTGQGCSAVSFGGFKWGLSNFVYNSTVTFTTPAHQNSWGYVNFEVSNPAIAAGSANGKSIAVCTAASNRINEFFYGDIPYTCTSEAGDSRETKFTFDLASRQLKLNESWVCSDQDPQFPILFSATGTSSLSLECDVNKWTNPNWTLGDIYSRAITTCKPVNLSLQPSDITAIA